MNANLLVVVSYYSARTSLYLKKLLSDIAYCHQNLLLVINKDNCSAESLSFVDGHHALVRPNIGMNIGAWDAAYKHFPQYGYYIFIQDECQLVRGDFVSVYKNELEKNDIGMTGESINYKWNHSWNEMLRSPLNYPINPSLATGSSSRVEYYLERMKSWNIDPGSNGRHLRSLVWGFKGKTLSRLNGFPVGFSKEECIASEIAVSKKVEQLGLRVTQVGQNPFSCFKHEEWRADGFSKK